MKERKGPKLSSYYLNKKIISQFKLHTVSVPHQGLFLYCILPNIRTFVVCARKRLSIPIAHARPLSPCHLVVVFVDAVLEFGSVLFDRLITHRVDRRDGGEDTAPANRLPSRSVCLSIFQSPSTMPAAPRPRRTVTIKMQLCNYPSQFEPSLLHITHIDTHTKTN